VILCPEVALNEGKKDFEKPPQKSKKWLNTKIKDTKMELRAFAFTCN